MSLLRQAHVTTAVGAQPCRAQRRYHRVKLLQKVLIAVVVGALGGALAAAVTWLACAVLFDVVGTMSGFDPYSPHPWLLMKVVGGIAGLYAAFCRSERPGIAPGTTIGTQARGSGHTAGSSRRRRR